MYETYKKDFPNITEQELMDLKLQFQTFDLNMDGLIDYNELGQVLDDLGDKSSQQRRKQYFDDMDADGSGAIDFEEFLHLSTAYRLASMTWIIHKTRIRRILDC